MVASACSFSEQSPTISRDVNPKPSNLELQFLTRDGCRNTAQMLANLNTGISTGKIAASYNVIRQENLPPNDPRIGYPTPTILMNGRDIFGLPVPQPPFPEPS